MRPQRIIRLVILLGLSLTVGHQALDYQAGKRREGLSRQLRTALVQRNYPAARTLLAQGARLDRWYLIPSWGSVLVGPAASGDAELVTALLNQGVDVNSTEDRSYSPLEMAAGYGHRRVVRILLDRGARVNVADDFGNTPLMLAAQYGHAEIVHDLVAHRADPSLTMDGKTAADCAAAYGHRELAHWLRAAGRED